MIDPQRIPTLAPGTLDGRVALVTGASRGIGLAIVERLTAAGARVMLSARTEETLQAAASSIDGETATFAANAGDPDAAEAAVRATVERFGEIDILVNNAATNPASGDLVDTELSAFDKIIQVNLRGPLVWTAAAMRAGLASRSGSVVNISSVGGLQFEAGLGAYNVGKAGLIHMTKVLAVELGPDVRVNAVAPGLVRTDFARSLWETREEQVARRLPLKRIGEPQDIADAVAFLASPGASWMTGQVIAIDGGATVA